MGLIRADERVRYPGQASVVEDAEVERLRGRSLAEHTGKEVGQPVQRSPWGLEVEESQEGSPRLYGAVATRSRVPARRRNPFAGEVGKVGWGLGSVTSPSAVL